MSQHDLQRLGGALFADTGQDGLVHRAFLRGAGLSEADVRRSPVIGICSSWSELNPCNAGLRDLADVVKEGVKAAGGIALEFPTISISEPFARPTSLFLRNLMSMDVEEMINSSPIDGVVLLAGCDKTVPAQIMGALSANKPALMLTAGPRAVPCYQNEPFTIDDLWPACERRRLGGMTDAEWLELEGRVNTGVGTCNVMGTALTLAAVAELLGFALPGSALPAAASARRVELARETGVQIVESVNAVRRPRELVTAASLENAFRVVCALGGSTNAVIHLEAIAGRNGLTIGSRRFEAWSATTPYVANVRPGGRLLLHDLEHAGGVPAVVHRIAALLNTSTATAHGQTWQEVIDATTFPAHPAIASLNAPLAPHGSLAMLHGNVAPRGAILKIAGPHEPRLQQHRGRLVVFESMADLHARLDDPDLDVNADSVLLLRGMGVTGAPGMPEVGHISIPAKLARAGVTDMLRLSDARMSGTAMGTIVLHITPEAAVGGPIGILRTGDEIELDVASGSIRHFLSDEALAARPPYPVPAAPARGYAWLHRQHALQPDFGCDFDFLRADFNAS